MWVRESMLHYLWVARIFASVSLSHVDFEIAIYWQGVAFYMQFCNYITPFHIILFRFITMSRGTDNIMHLARTITNSSLSEKTD